MTVPARRPAPAPVAEGWRVPIDMPVHDSGRNRGKPVGWLSLNNVAGGAAGAIARWRASKAWRAAAYNALTKAMVPVGLGRVYIEVELRFPDRLHRDPANFEPTVKPCIDSLQSMRRYVRKHPKTGRDELVIELGRGVVPGDDPRYVVRGPELPVGEPLGRANPIKGMVILHIRPLPPEVKPT
jgi:hypothetical protein